MEPHSSGLVSRWFSDVDMVAPILAAKNVIGEVFEPVDDKTKFIKQEIERSGFPFEMEITSILKEDGWDVLPSTPYWDEDEGKWREIDIKAYKSIEQGPDGENLKPYSLSVALIIECKKTDDYGWVFFPWPRDARDIELTRVRHIDFLTVVKRQSLLMNDVSKGRLPSRTEIQMLDLDPDLVLSYEAVVTPEVARKLSFPSELGLISPDIFRFLVAEEKALTYREIKLKGKGSSGLHEIFEAINVSMKATKYDMKLHSSGIHAGVELAKKGHEKGRFDLTIFLPIIVFGGELYTWRDGTVNEADEVLLEGRCHTERYFENMLIAVVKGSNFKAFLSRINEDYGELLRSICLNRGKLDEQVKMILESPYFHKFPSLT
ncbi:MAG: hypothetical protein ABID54_13350 [Pseudomonadota bacterium]